MQSIMKVPEWHPLFIEVYPWGWIFIVAASLLAGLFAYWWTKAEREANKAFHVKLAAQREAHTIEQAKRIRLNVQTERQRLGRPLDFHEMFLIQAEVILPPFLFSEMKNRTLQEMYRNGNGSDCDGRESN